MSDDLVKRLRVCAAFDPDQAEAADRIEQLEDENKRLLANATYDAELLVVYHRICQKNGCAPSSSDLVAGLAALAGEKKDE